MQHITVETAIEAIDRRHAGDPDGAELGYAASMTGWLTRLATAPSPELVVAVRAQHFERWLRPRSDYPSGRAGYLSWRRDAARAAANSLAELLVELGFSAAFVERVKGLMQKRGLGSDADAQILEDCACLVFLEQVLTDFARGRDRTKVVSIVARTWRKMSPQARQLALALVQPASVRGLLDEALA